MNAIAASLAAAALAAAPAPAPAAADPAGDWTGTLRTRTIDIRVGLELRRTATGYRGVYDSISQGYWGVPLRPARPDTPLTLQVTNLSGTLSFTWDPAARDWICAWREKAGVYTTILRRGVIPPAPAISPRDRIFLPLLAIVMVLEAAGIARLLQLRRRRKRQRAARAY
jgi:hypothetical protein